MSPEKLCQMPACDIRITYTLTLGKDVHKISAAAGVNTGVEQSGRPNYATGAYISNS
jgi:hypothetical protein